MDPVSAGLGFGGGLLGGVFGIIQNERNISFQKEQNEKQMAWNREQFDYQKGLNTLTMQREDNAVQRRAQDMKQAGINPLLAAGAPAQATSMQTGGGQNAGTAPHQDRNPGEDAINGAMTALQILGTKKNVEQQEATIAKTKQETENLKAENPNIAKQGTAIESNINKIREETKGQVSKGIRETAEMMITSPDLGLNEMGIEGTIGVSGSNGLGINATIKGHAGQVRKIWIPIADISEQVYNKKMTLTEGIERIKARVENKTKQETPTNGPHNSRKNSDYERVSHLYHK